MKLYMMLGNHTARTTGTCSAKAEDMAWNNIYEKLSPNPIPNDNPIPPLVFFDESEAPISVSMNAANDIAMRL